MTIRSALRHGGSAALLVLAALLLVRFFGAEEEQRSASADLAPPARESAAGRAPLFAEAYEVQRGRESASRAEGGPDLPPAAPPVKLSALRERFAGRALALLSPELELPIPDPVEPGACAFLLRLVDAATGERCASPVQLWRLDAPESETMTRGDQYVRALEVPLEGARIEQLAPGRYRLVAANASASGEDPAPFEVEETTVERVISIPLPKRIPLELALFDLEGRRVTEARVGVQLDYHARRETPRPRWELARRTPRLPVEDDLVREGSGGGYSTSARVAPRQRRANGAGWLELGSLPEGTREWLRPGRLEASVGDAQGPKGFVFELDPARTRWVSVVCTKELVLSSLRLRDGSDVRALAPHLQVRAEALPVALGEELTRWAEVPVIAALHRPDHPPLELRFTARDLPLPIRWLD